MHARDESSIPIAIVGIGCRLPPWLDTPDALWRALCERIDAVREVPPGRWNASEWVDADAQAPGKMSTRWGAFLDDVAGFDADFFRISKTEAKQMDPQQRIALEVACAALEDARIPLTSLAGSRTGVFVGAMWQEYHLLTGGDATAIRVHSATGWDNSVIPGRIAYALGLRGPSMTVATSSSSSLVAVHLAVQSLRQGESDLALAGGVNLMLHPHASVAMSKLGTQSPDGRCRAFDADGQGYVRGEGCGIVVLRRLSDALAAGDRIYAVVRGSAVNNDGASNGLTAPSADAQAEVVRAAWHDAGISPRDVAYVEAHGTGTPVGDPIEASALGAVFAEGRSTPLCIGSAKTNFGHLEPASGIVGLLKVALSLHHGELPPSLHFQTPRPGIDFVAHKLEVVTERRAWPSDGRRFAGVSSFGFAGTNAHVALAEAPPPAQVPMRPASDSRPVSLVISGTSREARARNAARLAEHLRCKPDVGLADVAYSLATARAHFEARAAVTVRSAAEAVEALHALAEGRAHPAVVEGTASPRHKVVFVFPGQGAQWRGMGKALLEQSTAFRLAIDACDRALRPLTGWSVLDLLRDDDDDLERVDRVQPALFAMYVGLAAAWEAFGLRPDAVVGHSQGEVAAAVVCGALSIEQGARIVAARSHAVRESGRPGAMALVERPVEHVRDLIAPYGDALSIAVVNTKSSTVVAGDVDAVEQLLRTLADTDVFSRRINVDYASHSAHMDALMPRLRDELAGIAPLGARIPFYSSVTGEAVSGRELDGSYWCKNLREPVRMDRALGRLLDDGHDVFVEVSPHPVLSMALTDAGSERGAVVVGSLHREQGGLERLWRALAELHVQGYSVDWPRAFEPLAARSIDLPTYAFQRQHLWLDTDVEEDTASAGGPALREQLLALPESERLPWLVGLVQAEAAAVLGLPDPSRMAADRVLRAQGFDSLTVVELRNRLVARSGVTLPAAMAFDYPTPRAIAGLLLERAGNAAVPNVARPLRKRRVPSTNGDDPVAIVAMACRLPGGIEDAEGFWDVLDAGRDVIGPFPARWGDLDGLAWDAHVTREGGFVREVEGFDAAFFGISPREAQSMDPQQRLLLELTWEALERANLVPEALRGSKTGVYVGAMSSDYDTGRRWNADAIDGYQLTGNASSVISGRIAYTLGLEGPALTIDTACSASLVALHVAAAALRRGECDRALVGGVTVMSTPQMFIEFSRLKGLASDGRCKSFSAKADGTSWAEGCGVLVLERLSCAERDGHRILALVRGTAINQDGRSQGLTAPNGLAQQRVLRDALADARLAPADVDAVEAHGTGTVLGDPIEAGALAEVFGPGRDAARPLYLGSAKSNLGHAQAAAGILGVIKMVLALERGRLPKTLHAEEPSPHVPWAGSGLALLHDARPWPRGERPRRAGVSAFGISGTNAHAILEEAPSRNVEPLGETANQAAYPLLLSGTDLRALRAQARRWMGWAAQHTDARWLDVVHTAAKYRTHFEARAAVTVRSVAEAVEALHALAEGRAHPAVVEGTASPRHKVVFVFPGQGAQWRGMGKALLEQSTAFRLAIDACDRALRPLTGWSVLDLLRDDDDLERVDRVQPALFAMYVGLAAAWEALGLRPDAVVGHSQGEVAAAVVCGALSVEQGARIVAARSHAVRESARPGAMALVERPVEHVRDLIAPYGEALSIAVVNTKSSTVVAGDVEAVEQLLRTLADTDVFSRRINVDYASHSAHMDALMPRLREELAGIAPLGARMPFYSSVTGEAVSGRELDGSYWCKNLREPVRMDRALGRLLDDGHDVFVEVSPHPVLSMALTDAGSERGAVVVGSLHREQGGLERLWRALAELHVQGYGVDWPRAFEPLAARSIDLPTYAFQRQHLWLEAPRPRESMQAAGLVPTRHPWLGAATALAGRDEHLFTGRLSLREQPWLRDHVALDDVLVPGAGLLDLALSAAQTVGAKRIAELTLLEPLALSEAAVRLQATAGAPDARGRRPFALYSQLEGTPDPKAWRHHASGQLEERTDAATDAGFEELRTWPISGVEARNLDDFYPSARARGLDYGPAFQGLTELGRRGDVLYGYVRLPESVRGAAGEYHLHPALLDAALHVLVAGLLDGDATATAPLLPFVWSDVAVYATGAAELRVRAELEHGEDTARATMWLADGAGVPVARVGGITLQRARVETKALDSKHLYAIDFQPLQLADPAALESGAASPKRLVMDVTSSFDEADTLEATQRITVDALTSLQRVLADPQLRDTELVWVTRGGLRTSALWGLLRTARAEQPERVIRAIDLDPEAPSDPALLERALATREVEVVLRAGSARIPRLIPVKADVSAPRPLDPDGTVLITGGTGELGRALALHLVRVHGVRHVVLTSRRGANAPHAEALARDLEAAGALGVRIATCDVAQRAEVAALLAGVDSSHPWTGIFHLAGVLDDGLVQGIDVGRLARVMSPKVAGALHLDELTEGMNLSAFVLFSSVAGVLGTAGQGSYAAANAFLDAMAAQRQRRGLVGQSLAWGLWEQAGVGMTAHLGKADLGRLRRQGIGALSLEEGLRLLDAALARPEANLVPVRLELGALEHALGDAEAPSMLRTLVQPRRRAPAKSAPKAASLRDAMATLPESERLPQLLEMVRHEVAAVLGLSGPDAVPPDKALRAQGLDSLTMVELRNRLSRRAEITLPATLAFDYPTPNAVAGLLLTTL
ncbi:type I polyketide synthase [Pendulispora brunnea]|uniref:Type I polyketide synthase n=1 Tax=Pendulispora brunnea TaxID=2905690 RepID=A0ABZ2KMH5_9BACT